MADQTLEILIKAKNESKAAYEETLSDQQRLRDKLKESERALRDYNKAAKELTDQQKVTQAVTKDLQDTFASLTSGLGPAGSALKALGGSALAGAAGVAVLGAAWTAAVGTLVSWTAGVIKAGGDIQDLATKAGVGTKAIQELAFAGKDVGVSQEAIATSLVNLSRRIEEGSTKTQAAVKGLGLTFEELKSQSPDEQFRAIADAMQGLSAGEQASFARSLGLSSEMLKLLNSDLAEATALSHELGAVMSNETIAAADALGDAAGHVTEAWEGVKTAVVEQIVQNGALKETFDDLATLLGSTSRLLRENGDAVGFLYQMFGGAALDGFAKGLELVQDKLEGVQRMLGLAREAAEEFAGAIEGADASEKNPDPKGLYKSSIFSGGGMKLPAEDDGKAAEKLLEKQVKAEEAAQKKRTAAAKKAAADEEAAWKAANAEMVSDMNARTKEHERQYRQQTDQALSEVERELAGKKKADAEYAAWAKKQLADEQKMSLDLMKRDEHEEDAAFQRRMEKVHALGSMFGELTQALQAFGVSSVSAFAQLAAGLEKGTKAGGDFAVALKEWQKGNKTAGGAGMFGAALGAAGAAYQSGSVWGGAATGASAAGAASNYNPYAVAGGAVVGGILGFFGGKAKAKQELEDMRKQLLGSVGGSMDELRHKAGLLGVDISKAFTTDKPKELKAIMDQMATAVDEQQQRWEGIQKALTGVAQRTKGFAEHMEQVGTATDADAASFQRIALYAGATFAAMVRETGDVIGALKALEDPLSNLSTLQDKFGFSASESLKKLLSLRSVLESNKGAADELQGLTQIMQGMGQAGMNSAELWKAFGQDAANIFAELTAGGAPAADALALMEPTLQSLWEHQQKFHDITDEATLALLAQAEAQGTVGDQMRNVNEQTLMVLLAIADVLGASIPEAFRRAGDAADNYGNTVRNIPPVPGGPPAPGAPNPGAPPPGGYPHNAMGGTIPYIPGTRGRGQTVNVSEFETEHIMTTPQLEGIIRRAGALSGAGGGLSIDSVNIHQQPGENGEELARRFIAELRNNGDLQSALGL